jgi:hypothetical protein
MLQPYLNNIAYKLLRTNLANADWGIPPTAIYAIIYFLLGGTVFADPHKQMLPKSPQADCLDSTDFPGDEAPKFIDDLAVS